MTDAHDEPDDALVDGLLAKARTKEWTPITDAHDEAAKALFAFAGDRRVVEIQVDASSVAIAAALRRAAADGAKAEREACLTSLAELNVQHWSMATESEFYHGRAVSIDAAINHLRARAKGGA